MDHTKKRWFLPGLCLVGAASAIGYASNLNSCELPNSFVEVEEIHVSDVTTAKGNLLQSQVKNVLIIESVSVSPGVSLLVLDIAVRNPTERIALISGFTLTFTNKELISDPTRPLSYMSSTATYTVYADEDSMQVKIDQESIKLKSSLSYPYGIGYEAKISIPLWQKVNGKDLDRFKIAFNFSDPPSIHYNLLLARINYSLGDETSTASGERFTSTVSTLPLSRF